MRFRVFAWPLILLLTAPVGAFAGAKKTPTPRPIGGLTFSDSYQLTVVNIDAFVTDKKGNPVEGLTKDDFRIFQDGTEREITNFAEYTHEVYRTLFATPTPGLAIPKPTPTPAPDQVSRADVKPIFMMVYVDNLNLRPLDRNRVLRQLRDFVRKNLQPPMQMMVVRFDRSLKIVQPFTSDPGEVQNALRSMRMSTGGRKTRDGDRRDVLDMMRKAKDQEGAAGSGITGTQGNYGRAYQLMKSYANEEANNLAFTVGALREAVSMLAGLPGRKSILYVSDGLQMIPGIDLFYEYSSLYHDTSILTLTTRYDRTDLFKSLVASASSQGVAFYTVGAQGLDVVGSGTAESRYAQDPLSSTVGTSSYNDSLHYMADGTGGRAIVNTNNFEAGFANIGHDLYNYYSLGYSLTSSGQDKIHTIKVELKNHPGYTLRYRRRYVEKSRESQVQDRVMAALITPVDDNPMDIDVATGTPSPATNEWWTVPLHISFPLDKVALLPEGNDYVGRVIVFVAARDPDGKQSDIQRQEHEVRIPAADYDKAKNQRFGVDLSMLMASGTYRVGVGLLDLVTQQASYQTVATSVAPNP